MTEEYSVVSLSAHNILSSRLLTGNLKIKVHIKNYIFIQYL
jgi:hypothetical protein